nr:hypothetical protein [Variovorax boronicumulans]
MQRIDRDDAGRQEVLDAEPGLHPWLRLKRWLLAPTLPEDLLSAAKEKGVHRMPVDAFRVVGGAGGI